MRNPLWIGLATVLMSCAGCVTPPHDMHGVTAPPPPQPIAPPAPRPVTAEQITAENCHQMAQALFDELDREANQAMIRR